MTNMVTDRKDQLVLYVVMAMAFFLDGLDGTIVTVALPEIGKSFAMSTSDSFCVSLSKLRVNSFSIIGNLNSMDFSH